MASVVVGAGRALWQQVKDGGSVDDDAATVILLEAGCPAEKVKYGKLYPLGRKWLKKVDGVFHLGEKSPPSPNGQIATPPGSVSSADLSAVDAIPCLDTVEERVQALLQILGIGEKGARAAATVMGTYDLSDPQQLSEALGVVSLSPTVQRQFYVTWTRSMGLSVTYPELSGHGQPQAASQSPTGGRDYIVEAGKPHRVGAGEVGEFTFAEAIRVAELERAGTGGDHGGSVLTALVSWMQESQRAQLEGIKMLLESQHRDPSTLDEVTTTLVSKAIDSLINPRESTGFAIKVGDGENGDGDGGEVSFDIFERFEKLRLARADGVTKRSMVDSAIKLVPNLLLAGLDAAKSLQNSPTAQQPGQRLAPAQQPQAFVNRPCIKCGTPLQIHPSWSTFGCPECNTFQNQQGEILQDDAQVQGQNPQQDASHRAPGTPGIPDQGVAPAVDYDSIPPVPSGIPSPAQGPEVNYTEKIPAQGPEVNYYTEEIPALLTNSNQGDA